MTHRSATFAIVVTVAAMIPTSAVANHCRQCDFGPPLPVCFLTTSGYNLCDDTEQGKCILTGGTCSHFAFVGDITPDGRVNAVLDGAAQWEKDVLRRECDNAVVARNYSRSELIRLQTATSRVGL